MPLKKEIQPGEVAQLIQRCLALLKSVNQFSEVMHINKEYKGLSREDVFILAYKVRMLRQSQAIETLIQSGLFDPASTILRVLLEQGFVLSALSDDKRLMNELFKQDGAESAKALKGLRTKLKQEERAPGLSDEILDQEIAKLPTGSGFIAHNWAGLAGMESAYATVYRKVSLFSHGGAGPISEYLEFDKNNSPSLKPHISPLDIPDQLVSTAALALDSIITLPLAEHGPDVSKTQSKLQTELRELAAIVLSMSVAEVE